MVVTYVLHTTQYNIVVRGANNFNKKNLLSLHDDLKKNVSRGCEFKDVTKYNFYANAGTPSLEIFCLILPPCKQFFLPHLYPATSPQRPMRGTLLI